VANQAINEEKRRRTRPVSMGEEAPTLRPQGQTLSSGCDTPTSRAVRREPSGWALEPSARPRARATRPKRAPRAPSGRPELGGQNDYASGFERKTGAPSELAG